MASFPATQVFIVETWGDVMEVQVRPIGGGRTRYVLIIAAPAEES